MRQILYFLFFEVKNVKSLSMDVYIILLTPPTPTHTAPTHPFTHAITLWANNPPTHTHITELPTHLSIYLLTDTHTYPNIFLHTCSHTTMYLRVCGGLKNENEVVSQSTLQPHLPYNCVINPLSNTISSMNRRSLKRKIERDDTSSLLVPCVQHFYSYRKRDYIV